MRKNIIYIFCSLFIMSFFLSCGDDYEDYDSNVLPKESKLWGYFEGHIDNKYVSVANEKQTLGRKPVFSIRQAIDESATIKSDSINHIFTQVVLSEKIAFTIVLFKFTPKIRNASVTPLINCNEGYIRVLLKDETNDILKYVPVEDHPFKIEIINIEWESPLDPIIEVKISGRLFNVDNLSDSIVVDGVYGTR